MQPVRILRAYILDDPFFCKPAKPLGAAVAEEEQDVEEADLDKLGMTPPASPEPLAAEALSDEETDEIMAIEKVDHKEAEARKGRQSCTFYVHADRDIIPELFEVTCFWLFPHGVGSSPLSSRK